MGNGTNSHKDLIVWQKSMDLTLLIYKLTEKFPQREVYALSSQMRRAAISIASNIAEGRNRGTRRDFSHFLRMAYGSASELETQLLICKQLSFCTEETFILANDLLTEISKMLRAMIKKLEARS
ncbi:four helix bundle protein [Candidatus Kaiserbacteria bacterium]|nr:four helix bundle protein [Candidatus Kaiserbacteria bacterium]